MARITTLFARFALGITTLLSPAVVGGVLVASSVVVSADAHADDAAKELIQRVQAKYKSVTSIKATVTQTSRNELFGTETLVGELLVKLPAKMRWTFGSSKAFVTNGTKMWIYTAEEKQVIEYDDISSGRQTAESLLTSLDKLNEMFDIKVLATGEYGHVLELRPHSEAQFKKVQLTLDKNLMVTSVVITDTFNNTQDLAFANVQLNVPADDSLFNFKAPPGVDVVKAPTN